MNGGGQRAIGPGGQRRRSALGDVPPLAVRRIDDDAHALAASSGR